MKLLLVGPPACGKGSVGQVLSEKYKIPLISMGQTLRELPETHPRYKENKAIMDSGGLSPDDLVAEIIKERLDREDCINGYILDGYGRTLDQFKLFEPPIDLALFINIPQEETLRRITGRRFCEADGKVYNIYTLPPEEIAKCPGELTIREDDKEEVVLNRLKKYDTFTLPLIKYLFEIGLLKEIDGLGTPAEVLSRVEEAISAKSL